MADKVGRKVALLVGVGNYGTGLESLQCPANGVEAMRSILSNPEIGEFDEVIPLIDPNVGEMRSRIGEVFARLGKEDLLLFYFTGHGIKDRIGNFYLTTTESYRLENNQINLGTAVEAEFVKRVIRSSYAERKVVILDCCFAAAFADGFLSMDDDSVDIETQLGTKELGGKGCCVLTASTSRRYALEQEGEALSVYTRYLTQGLQTGGAALDGQAFISAKHLHDYVLEQVRVAAPAMEPAIYNAREGDGIAIAKAQVDSEQRYRKQVQKKVQAGKGRLRPAAKRNLELLQTALGLSAEQAVSIQAEELKPYQEKEKHLKLYKKTLAEEKEYGYPLDAEAIQELEEMKRRLNLRDEDVLSAENQVLGGRLSALVPPQPSTEKAASSPQRESSRYPTFNFETVRVNEQGAVIETISGEAECFTEDLGNGVMLEMVRIPGGKFLMGAAPGEVGASEDEYPQHEVAVPEFWMGKYAVTQAQWAAVAALSKIDRDLARAPANFKGQKRPVEQVSWEEAIEFCKRLSQRSKREYRLPTEAQWEYACRAKTMTPFHFGSTMTTDLANYRGTDYTSSSGTTYLGNYGEGPKGEYRKETTEVDKFQPNGLGLHDMHGNVWEWCLDGWHDSYEGAPNDGSVWKSSDEIKVLRGGSWSHFPADCRAAPRGRSSRDGRSSNLGFRVIAFAPRT
ncbi:MAG: SUMF1/EgtB/PvdO family nonheme iron enzyme [Phormidesmis sp.]